MPKKEKKTNNSLPKDKASASYVVHFNRNTVAAGTTNVARNEPPGYKAGEEDASEDTSVYLESSDARAAYNQKEDGSRNKIAKTKKTEYSARSSANEAQRSAQRTEYPFAKAMPVSGMPPLRQEVLPRPHPIQQEEVPTIHPSAPPILAVEETEDKAAQQPESKRRWRWVVASLLLLAVIVGVIVGVTVPAVKTSGSSFPDSANDWLADDIRENELSTNEIEQRGTLAKFFYSTLGNTGRWENTVGWLDHDSSECKWFGVSCSGGIVTGLSLSENGLGGNLPSALSKLSLLVELTLLNNDISGTIPTELAAMTDLEHLNMYNNKLFGTLPTETGLLVNLVSLLLSLNDLKGRVPAEIGNLPKLESLLLDNNEFTGTVPSEVCALKQSNLSWMEADCGGKEPKIQCSCCTTCCPQPDRC